MSNNETIDDEPTNDEASQSVWDELEAFDEDQADPEPTAPFDADSTETASESEEIFDEMDVADVDGEALWDELAGLESYANEPLDTAPDPTVAEADDSATREVAAEQVDSAESHARIKEDENEQLVDKRRYCQQCPYFSKPPEVACSHEGTTIVEVLMDGQFRLRNCPVVTDSGPDRTMLNDEH